ncbi:hypothetical protein BGZ94_010427, partial [Podila epigama]
MSNNRGYNNIINNSMQNMNNDNSYELQQHSYQGGDINDEQHLNQDNQRSKRRIANPAKAIVGGVTNGAHAIRGGISQVEKGVSQVGDRLNAVPVVQKSVTIFSDYRKFIDRGNVIDLAVAVVVGAAFTA